MTGNDLLREIETAAAEFSLAPSTLCRQAVEAGHIHARLRSGGSVRLDTAKKITDWIKAERRRRRKAA